jgi:hypothetical protein
MQRIRRQFGAKFAEMLAASPTLVADLKEIRRRDVKIRRVGGACHAESVASDKMILIGRNCSRVVQLLYLAHEAEHVLRGMTPDPSPRKMTRRQYVKASLDEETQCVLHEIQVAGELMAAGYKVDDDTMTWYRRYRRGGRKAVRKAVEKTLASATDELYPRYYGRQYDEAAGTARASAHAGCNPAPSDGIMAASPIGMPRLCLCCLTSRPC